MLLNNNLGKENEENMWHSYIQMFVALTDRCLEE
jgi:hypothetical protein